MAQPYHYSLSNIVCQKLKSLTGVKQRCIIEISNRCSNVKGAVRL